MSLLDHRPIDSGLVSYCTDHNINILAYGVLAGGFLTDKWRGQPEPSLATQVNQINIHIHVHYTQLGGILKASQFLYRVCIVI